MKIVDLGTPSKSTRRQNGAQNRQRCRKFVKRIDTRPPWDQRVKRLNMQKGQVDWTFVLSMFFVVALFNFSCIYVSKIMLVLVFAVAPNTSRNIKQNRRPKSTKWRQNCRIKFNMVVTHCWNRVLPRRTRNASRSHF